MWSLQYFYEDDYEAAIPTTFKHQGTYNEYDIGSLMKNKEDHDLKKMIQKVIIEEIKVAGFHSISADEVTASNDEILSVCMRYVDANKAISELFMDFAGE